MKQFYKLFSSAIPSGISISISCISYLKLGGIAGAILFSFGLITVLHYGWKLYTGASGFVQNREDIINLGIILIGNIIGCIIMALIMRFSQPGLTLNALEVINIRLGLGTFQCLLMGIGCGFIMTTVVKFGREYKYLPLLFGVPIFIICGFLHSIADAFYISMLPLNILCEQFKEIIFVYIMIIIGNFIGCNLVRIITFNKHI